MKTLKTILFYNPFYSQKDFYFGFGQKPFIDANCKVSNCYTTDDKELFGNNSPCLVQNKLPTICVLFMVCCALAAKPLLGVI